MPLVVKEKNFYRTLLAVAIPSALQNMVSLSVGLADTLMVGTLGDEVLAGVAVSNQVSVFLFGLLTGLANGASALVAQYWGKKDVTAIKRIIALVFWLCAGVGTVAAAAAFLFPEKVLGLMAGDNAELIEAGVPYLTSVCFSFIFFAATTSLVTMLRNVEVVVVALVTSVAAAVVNIALNWAFIFGRLGLPAMGAQGAGIATCLARAFECLLIIFLVLKVQKKFPLKVSDFFKTKMYMAKDYARHGLPIALGDSQWALVTLVKAGIIGHLGTMMVSANAITDTVMAFGMVSAHSLAAGACVVIGKTVGEGDMKKVRQYSNMIQIIFAGMAVIMAAAVFGLRMPLVGLFNVSDETKRLAAVFIAIGAATLLGTLYHAACFIGINRGAGDGRFVFIVDMICGWLILLPALYFSAHVWMLPLPLVYFASRIDQCFKWIIAFVRLRGGKWIRVVTREST
ncbi:MAG: MATE family efflux transporter [Defluviitaleaceae bacterium]|nr:MATE family efflux transporter [Defluviitaleaceae bacterium]